MLIAMKNCGLLIAESREVPPYLNGIENQRLPPLGPLHQAKLPSNLRLHFLCIFFAYICKLMRFWDTWRQWEAGQN